MHVSCTEDVVPRLLASPKQSPEQVAAATIAALDTAETRKVGEDQVEDIIGIFKGIYDGHDFEQQGPAPPMPGMHVTSAHWEGAIIQKWHHEGFRTLPLQACSALDLIYFHCLPFDSQRCHAWLYLRK